MMEKGVSEGDEEILQQAEVHVAPRVGREVIEGEVLADVAGDLGLRLDLQSGSRGVEEELLQIDGAAQRRDRPETFGMLRPDVQGAVRAHRDPADRAKLGVLVEARWLLRDVRSTASAAASQSEGEEHRHDGDGAPRL